MPGELHGPVSRTRSTGWGYAHTLPGMPHAVRYRRAARGLNARHPSRRRLTGASCLSRLPWWRPVPWRGRSTPTLAEIFISHATKAPHPDDDQSRLHARAIRDAAFDQLTAAGHEPMLDRRCLKPGDDWSARLQRWLGECHGALVIVDEQGLGSKWLRDESTVLSWRRSQDECFRLITIVVGGLSHAQLRGAGLDWLVRYQTIHATGVDQAVTDAVAAFKKLEARPNSGPLAAWIGDLSARLATARLALEKPANCLGIEPSDLNEYGDPHVMLAHGLLHAKPDAARAALEALWRGGLRGRAFLRARRPAAAVVRQPDGGRGVAAPHRRAAPAGHDQRRRLRRRSSVPRSRTPSSDPADLTRSTSMASSVRAKSSSSNTS